MQVNPEDGPPEFYVTWSDPRITDFENRKIRTRDLPLFHWATSPPPPSVDINQRKISSVSLSQRNIIIFVYHIA